MSQIDFEHECSRAQLLGIEPPTWDEFCARQAEKTENVNADVEDDGVEPDHEVAEALNVQGENLKKNIGGFDELNNILTSTQLKINKFKSVCGSFTNLMKIKNWKSDGVQSSGDVGPSSVPATPSRNIDGSGDSAMASEVASQVDRLDSLLGKAERAEISMSCQNKQMKAYIRK